MSPRPKLVKIISHKVNITMDSIKLSKSVFIPVFFLEIFRLIKVQCECRSAREWVGQLCLCTVQGKSA